MQATGERRLTRPHRPLAADLDPPRNRLDVSRDTAQRAVHMLANEDKMLRFPGLGWYVAE